MPGYPLPLYLLTVSDFLALGEDEHGRSELVEGNLLLSPSGSLNHQRALMRLLVALLPQVPGHLQALHNLDVDLQLVPPDGPGTVRRVDVLVVDQDARERVNEEGGCLRASDLTLAVEIVSRGSRRTDHVVKRAEYQDAAIPFYWVVDPDEPVSLLAYRLTEEFGYVESARTTGTYTAEEPFPVTVELNELV